MKQQTVFEKKPIEITYNEENQVERIAFRFEHATLKETQDQLTKFGPYISGDLKDTEVNAAIKILRIRQAELESLDTKPNPLDYQNDEIEKTIQSIEQKIQKISSIQVSSENKASTIQKAKNKLQQIKPIGQQIETLKASGFYKQIQDKINELNAYIEKITPVVDACGGNNQIINSNAKLYSNYLSNSTNIFKPLLEESKAHLIELQEYLKKISTVEMSFKNFIAEQNRVIFLEELSKENAKTTTNQSKKSTKKTNQQKKKLGSEPVKDYAEQSDKENNYPIKVIPQEQIITNNNFDSNIEWIQVKDKQVLSDQAKINYQNTIGDNLKQNHDYNKTKFLSGLEVSKYRPYTYKAINNKFSESTFCETNENVDFLTILSKLMHVPNPSQVYAIATTFNKNSIDLYCSLTESKELHLKKNFQDIFKQLQQINYQNAQSATEKVLSIMLEKSSIYQNISSYLTANLIYNSKFQDVKEILRTKYNLEDPHNYKTVVNNILKRIPDNSSEELKAAYYKLYEVIISPFIDAAKFVKFLSQKPNTLADLNIRFTHKHMMHAEMLACDGKNTNDLPKEIGTSQPACVLCAETLKQLKIKHLGTTGIVLYSWAPPQNLQKKDLQELKQIIIKQDERIDKVLGKYDIRDANFDDQLENKTAIQINIIKQLYENQISEAYQDLTVLRNTNFNTHAQQIGNEKKTKLLAKIRAENTDNRLTSEHIGFSKSDIALSNQAHKLFDLAKAPQFILDQLNNQLLNEQKQEKVTQKPKETDEDHEVMKLIDTITNNEFNTYQEEEKEFSGNQND